MAEWRFVLTASIGLLFSHMQDKALLKSWISSSRSPLHHNAKPHNSLLPIFVRFLGRCSLAKLCRAVPNDSTGRSVV
eukprot:scaffold307698_cov18-Tisochrysis_lutea.AAC.1